MQSPGAHERAFGDRPIIGVAGVGQMLPGEGEPLAHALAVLASPDKGLTGLEN